MLQSNDSVDENLQKKTSTSTSLYNELCPSIMKFNKSYDKNTGILGRMSKKFGINETKLIKDISNQCNKNESLLKHSITKSIKERSSKENLFFTGMKDSGFDKTIKIKRNAYHSSAMKKLSRQKQVYINKKRNKSLNYVKADNLMKACDILSYQYKRTSHAISRIRRSVRRDISRHTRKTEKVNKEMKIIMAKDDINKRCFIYGRTGKGKFIPRIV